jgi:enediyne biosynthesis protein E4
MCVYVTDAIAALPPTIQSRESLEFDGSSVLLLQQIALRASERWAWIRLRVERELTDGMAENAPGAQAQARLPASQRQSRLVLAIVFVGALVWGGWSWWADRRFRDEITAIELEMANGRFAIAARDLIVLLEREPDAGEAAFLLGRCEQERGRTLAAGQAFARIAPGSAYAHKAILARMRLAHDKGQFAAAEQLINEVADDPRSDRAHVRALLVPIYSQLGRLDEAQRLLEDWWEHLNEMGEGASEPAIDQVRMHIELALRPNPVEDVRTYLDQASKLAPDDDRVWLGRANLAVRTGEYDAANRLLDACLSRRPEDVPVWWARLNWGIATNKTDKVEEAMKHIPAALASLAQIHRLSAWLCAQRGDVAGERQQLEALVAANPDDLAALNQLIQLAVQHGQPALAVDFGRKKEEIERLRARYQKLFDRNQPNRDAEEMSELADQLGRTFEARGFLTIEIAEDPARDDLRSRLLELNHKSRAVENRTETLADAVARALGNDGMNAEKTAKKVSSPEMPG